MDPRMREDDGGAAFLHSLVIPAEPALDLIGGQESIPVLPCSARAQRSLFHLFY